VRCRIARLRLHAGRETLSGRERAGLDAHLEGCGACRAAAARADAVLAALEAHRPVRLQVDVTAAVMERVGEIAAAPSAETRWTLGSLAASLLALAAAAVGASIGFLLEPASLPTALARASELAAGAWDGLLQVVRLGGELLAGLTRPVLTTAEAFGPVYPPVLAAALAAGAVLSILTLVAAARLRPAAVNGVAP
jgi:hypothetical protein